MIDSISRDAIDIWNAGVEAVRGKRLIEQAFAIRDHALIIDDFHEVPLESLSRILILGAGKASAGMADGFEAFWRRSGCATIAVEGWLNAPDGTFTPELTRRLQAPPRLDIRLHPARPAGVNEPTEAGVLGTRKILELAQQADASTLVLCFISGGASALLPAPIAGLPLLDKLELTRFLSRSGASIEMINEVRRCLSDIKGGGLARAACRARQIVGLIISDVLGDPIHLIGSGPTILEPAPNPVAALEVLERWDPEEILPRGLRVLLRQQIDDLQAKSTASLPSSLGDGCGSDKVSNYVLANNASSVDAAGVQAVAMGYSYWMESVQQQGLGVDLFARMLLRGIEMGVVGQGPDCLILGGEPTLQLPPPDLVGQGGRNQQLALELMILMANHPSERIRHSRGIAIVCGGTDGEDGPTSAAGAIVNEQIMDRARQLKLDFGDFVRRCDAYNFFEAVGGLLVTGPTNTNVCDLSVAVIDS